MIFNLRTFLLRTIIKLYSKAWSAIIVLMIPLYISGYYFMSGDVFIAMKKKYDATILAIKNKSKISHPDLEESVKERTALFYIAHKRLDNINWGTL